MFRTNDAHEAPTFAFIHGTGIRMWHTVGLELRVPYFLVVRGHKEKSAWFQDSYLLRGDADLVGVCEDAIPNGNIKILQISILLPENTSAGWQLKEVREVWADTQKNRPPILIGLDGELLPPRKTVRPFSNKTSQRIYLKESTHWS